MGSSKDHGSSTRSVHAGEARDKPDKSLTTPITQTATFVFDTLQEFESFKAGERQNFEYGRYGNPTQLAAERKLAALDNAEDALLFPTGMSALTSVLMAMLRSGQHMIVVEDCYRMTAKFCSIIQKFGIESTFVKPGDYEALKSAVRPTTRLILTESPTNPHLNVLDLKKLVPFAKEHRLKVLIDSTLATPINQRPLDFGVDLVIHSATKYLGGHNDLLLGSVCGASPIIEAIRDYCKVVGTTPDPNSSYLLIRGLKTLAIRVERQNETAMRIAQYLESHKKIGRVFYPGLESHSDHRVAVEQMSGFGGMVSFEIDGGLDCAQRFVHELEIPYLAPSLGGVETLVSHPATVSYYDLSQEERLSIGITDELVRYAAGIEDPEDLIADVEQALEKI